MSTAHQPHTLAVVFDLDDTLYAERDYIRSGYRAIDAYLRQSFDIDRLTHNGLVAGDWLWERFCGGEASGAFDALSETFDLALTREDIGQLVEVYRTHRPDIQPLAGAVEMLASLKARYRLGVLSDGFLPAQQLKLDALGLGDCFASVIFTEVLGREYWKPSPAGFEAIARELAVDHDACVYVGDNPSKDFVAPNALGWLTVQITRPGQVHAHKPAPPGGQASKVVHSWDEMVAVIEAH